MGDILTCEQQYPAAHETSYVAPQAPAGAVGRFDVVAVEVVSLLVVVVFVTVVNVVPTELVVVVPPPSPEAGSPKSLLT